MPEEDLETPELKEEIDKRIEEHEEHATPRWIKALSLSTAIIAVIAAVASLESGASSNEAILAKSAAMLDMARASDQWAYFQAKGVKAAIAEGQADLFADTKPDAAAKLRDQAARNRGEAKEIEKAAHEKEASVEDHEAESKELMEHHHRFAIAVTLLQISIALSAIAALIRLKPLWFVGLAVSTAGVAMFVQGLL